MPIICNEYAIKRTEVTDLASVHKEILAVAKRAAKANCRTRYEVVLPTGKHTLTDTFRLSAKKNPELDFLELTIRTEYPGMAEISSLVRLDGQKFVKAEGQSYFTYDFVKEEGKKPLFRDLFLNFQHICTGRSRRFRNVTKHPAAEKLGANEYEGLWIPTDIAERMASAPLGTPEIMMPLEWTFAILHVVGLDLTRTCTEEGVSYTLAHIKEGELEKVLRHTRPLHWGRCHDMYVFNSPGLLEVNTFAYDYENGVLYLNPENPEYTKWHAMEYPACEVLFELDGIKNATIDGITFYGATSTYACENLYLSGQANTLGGYGGVRTGRLETAAILLRDVNRITVSRCHFHDLGTNGVQAVDFSVGVNVRDCTFENVDMCGVTVGNPSWEWYDPKNRTFAARVENCHFRHIAYEYPSAPCIYFGQVDGLKILHNTVEDCGYSAISVGWNWDPVSWELGERVNIRNAEIAYNRLENFMQLLRDGGAIYVVGSNCNRATTSERFNHMHDNFAVVEGSRKTFAGKYGYYCDGSSSNWTVTHSAIFNIPLFAIFSQPHPQALSFHNTFADVYSNTPAHANTHVPARDVVRESYFYDDLSPEEFLAKYPEAKHIADAAGCDLPM